MLKEHAFIYTHKHTYIPIWSLCVQPVHKTCWLVHIPPEHNIYTACLISRSALKFKATNQTNILHSDKTWSRDEEFYVLIVVTNTISSHIIIATKPNNIDSIMKLYLWGNWDTKVLNNLPNVTLLITGQARIYLGQSGTKVCALNQCSW